MLKWTVLSQKNRVKRNVDMKIKLICSIITKLAKGGVLMPEEKLCQLGCTEKTLSYIDIETDKYIQVYCRLRETITQEYLKQFFSMIYSMKLDEGYSQSFKKNYNTRDLIECFQAILMEQNVISLQQLYNILNNIKNNYLPAEYAIQEFFNLFEVTKVISYSLEEYNSMIRAYSLNLSLTTQDPNFSKETKAISSNSNLIEIEVPTNDKTKEVEKNKEKRLVKIRVRNHLKNNT